MTATETNMKRAMIADVLIRIVVVRSSAHIVSVVMRIVNAAKKRMKKRVVAAQVEEWGGVSVVGVCWTGPKTGSATVAAFVSLRFTSVVVWCKV